MASGSPPRLRLTQRVLDDRVVAELDGTLGVEDTRALTRRLSDLIVEKRRSLFVDLGRVRLLDSAWLRMLLRVSRTALEQGVAVVVVGASEECRRLLRLSGLDQQLTVHAPG